MKLVRCRDHGFDCEFEAHGHNDDDVIQQAAKHATSVHGLQVTPELAKQVKDSIKTVDENAPS